MCTVEEPKLWRRIPNFLDYEVSDSGDIKSYKYNKSQGKILKRLFNENGYPITRLSDNNGVFRSRKIHQLVLEAFIGPCPKGLQTCHSNGIRSDNRLSNLRWDTRKSNDIDKIKHKITNEQPWLHRLTIQQVREIRADSRSQHIIADDYNINQSTVSRIKSRKRLDWIKENV